LEEVFGLSGDARDYRRETANAHCCGSKVGGEGWIVKEICEASLAFTFVR
jgi:hypothetical protein